jgi:3-dehydroquinate dehydratase-1
MTKNVPNKTSPKIIGVITSDNVGFLFDHEAGSDSLKVCDVLEFRADTFSDNLLLEYLTKVRTHTRAISTQDKPILFTIRLEKDGGNWKKETASRYSIFNQVIDQELVDWVDMEVEEAEQVPKHIYDKIKKLNIKLMISHHNFQRSYKESEFIRKTDEMAEFHPDIVKFAVTAQSREDFFALLDYSSQLALRYPMSCLISMGEYGPVSRIGSPLIGAPITYGYFGNKSVVAGQIEVRELYRQINKLTEMQTDYSAAKQLTDLLFKVANESQTA